MKSYKDIVYRMSIVLLSALRLLLQSRLPVFGRPVNSDDDMLMVSYADSIRHGAWLGGYKYSTLEKFPGQGILLAVSDWAGLPYMLTLGLMWLGASLVLLCALRRWKVNRWAALISFAVVVFSPVMLYTHSQRLYCLASVAPTVLALASSFLAIMAPPDRDSGPVWPYVLVAAVSAAFYSVLRQDAVWVLLMTLAFAAVAAVVAVVRFRVSGREPRRLLAALVCAVLPVLSFLAASFALARVNGAVYGVRVKSDFTEGGFARACLALMSIRPEEEKPKVYVQESVLDMACRHSPTLNRLKATLDGRRGRNRAGKLPDGEWEREYYAWYLRWSASDVGVYANGAVGADRFFSAVADEICDAIDGGRMERRNAILLSPFTGPMTLARFKSIFVHSLRCGAVDTVSFKGMKPAYVESDVKRKVAADNLAIMEDISHSDIPSRPLCSVSRVWQNRYKAGVAAGTGIAKVYMCLGRTIAVAAMAVFVAGWIFLLSCPRCRRDATTWSVMAFATVALGSFWMVLFIVSANFFEVRPDSTQAAYTPGAVVMFHLFSLGSLILVPACISRCFPGHDGGMSVGSLMKKFVAYVRGKWLKTAPVAVPQA